MPEDQAGFVIPAGLEEGGAELEQRLGGKVRPGANLLDLFLFPLDFFEFVWGGGGFPGDLGPQRREVRFQLGDQLVLARNGAEPGNGLVEAATSQFESGELQGGLGGEGGTARGGKLPVDLPGAGEGGLRLGFFEVGQEFVRPAGLGKGLHVVDIIRVGLVLVCLARLVQGLAGLGIFPEEQVDPGLQKKGLRPGRRFGIVLEEGGHFLERVLKPLFPFRGFLGGGVRLAGGALRDEVHRLLLDVLFRGGGGHFAIGRDGLGPFGKVVEGAGLKKVGAGQVGGLRVGLDEVRGQLVALLVTAGIEGLENLFGGLRGILGGEGSESRHPGQRQGEQEGLPCRHGDEILRGWGALGRAEPTRKQPFFPLILRGLWPNHFPLMILNESALEGLAA